MEYNGWTLYDEVTLVIKKENSYKYKEYPQGYVVNPKDKKQLNTAINWGRIRHYKKDKNGEYIVDSKGNSICDILEPEIITVKNEGFKLTLLDCANGSYQGGKLSFWNCLIKNKEVECVVGIDSKLLLNVLLQNNFTHGTCEKELKFARCSGGVGLLNENMTEYKEALKDMESKRNINKNKTSKWREGHNYITLTKDDTYLGKLYCPISIDVKHSYEYFSSNEICITFSKNKNPYRYCVVETDRLSNITKLSNLFEKLYKNSLNKKEELEKSNKSCTTIYDVLRCYSILLDNYETMTKLPSRREGDFVIDMDVPFGEYIDSYMRKIKSIILELLKNVDNTLSIYDLDKLFIYSCRESFEDNIGIINEILKIDLTQERMMGCYGKGNKFRVQTLVDQNFIQGIYIDKLI